MNLLYGSKDATPKCQSKCLLHQKSQESKFHLGENINHSGSGAMKSNVDFSDPNAGKNKQACGPILPSNGGKLSNNKFAT